LHQLAGNNGVLLIRAREVQNDACPQFIFQVERFCILTRVLTQLAHLRIGLWLKRHSPHLAQFLTTSVERSDHALDVHIYRVQADVESESEQRGLFTAGEGPPDRFVFPHQHKNAAHHLVKHGAQV